MNAPEREIKDLRPWSCPVCRDDLNSKTTARTTQDGVIQIIAVYSCSSCGYWFEQPHQLNQQFDFEISGPAAEELLKEDAE